MTVSARHPLFDRYERLLCAVGSPSRYAGGEFAAERPVATATARRVLVAYPDLYEAAWADPAREVVRSLLAARPDFRVECACLPARDLERALAAHDLPLFSLASRTPLHTFDLIHFVIPEAACFLNVAAMLHLGGIPIAAADRGAGDPLVTASGPPLLAPEAVAPLLDLALIGEVEDALAALAEQWPALRAAGLGPREIAIELGRRLDGAYAPAGYRIDAARGGAPVPVDAGLAASIRPARVHDLDRVALPAHPPVPGLRTARPAIHLEIRRGADPAEVRAADAAAAPSPPRRRSLANLLAAFETWFSATGLETIVIAGDTPAAHPDLPALVRGLDTRLHDLPTRIDVEGLPLAAWRPLFAAGRALAPGRSGRGAVAGLAVWEATPALARRLGRDVDRAALVNEAEALYRAGYEGIAGEAVIGVPGERPADVLAIGRLARDLSAARRGLDGRFGRVELRIRAWIPRPHTDGERGALLDGEAFAGKLQAVRDGLGRRREVRLRVADFDRARVEALLARGDRSLAAALAALAREGGRIYPEQPAEPPEPVADRLLAAARRTPGQAHAPLPETAPLPWAHIVLDPHPA